MDGRAGDILERPEAAADQLARLVGSLTDYAIFLLDPEGHVLTWNPGAERAKGYRAQEIVGEHFSRFYTPEDRERGRPAQVLAAAAREGRCADEGWRVRRDGTRFWASVVVTAIRAPDGELLGFGKVTRDLTERRRAQDELERFALVAAHDLQEPLRTVGGFAELMRRRFAPELPEQAGEFLDHMTDAVARMQRLIGDLLAYARSSGPVAPPQPVVVAAVASVVLADLTAAIGDRGLEVEVSLPPDAVVLADPGAVEQVLQNLLSNAIRFADRDRPSVGLDARRHAGGWRVCVSDNGQGIPEDRREDVFESFVRLSRDDHHGTGLGLSICRRIVERLGGSIGVEASDARGARFWFELPAADGSPAAAP